MFGRLGSPKRFIDLGLSDDVMAGTVAASPQVREVHVPMESDGHSRGNPRMYELIENAPKTGKSPTVWAFPQFVDFLKVAGQPVQGPWPPHQEPRPDPTDVDVLPVAIPDPEAATPLEPDFPVDDGQEG